MATGNMISCNQFKEFLVSQEPVYDKQILKDIRPFDGLIGYYATTNFDAYTGVQHTYDRFKSVFPNVTNPWTTIQSGNCLGQPCDPVENKIGWGYERKTYNLEGQSWASQLLCFDDIMTKTRAKDHFRQIIDDVLRPATNWVMTYYLQRKAMELASAKITVKAGLPEDTTFTWEAGGYSILDTNYDPTGRLTPDILRSRVTRQYFLGAINAGKNGFDKLELHTDKDTFHWLQKEDPTLKDKWRFGEFAPAAKEFYEYGFMGFVGDFMVKVLQFPMRFNKMSAGRYQLVLPYKNVATTEGIGSDFNPDYENAQYQISYINNRRALIVEPFIPEAVNQQMPFMVRDYGGRWKFVTNDLGADCNGKPIDNSRGNKGKFIADFRLAIKPAYPEWLEVFFHKRDKPCILIIDTCNADPGYPSQDYNSANGTCPSIQVFTAVAQASDGHYVIAGSGVRCDGNIVATAAIDQTTLAGFVTALQTTWAANGMAGTWTVYDATTKQIILTGGTCSSVTLQFAL